MSINFGALDDKGQEKPKGKQMTTTVLPAATVATVSKRDLETIKALFASYKAEIERMLKEAQEFVITDDATNAEAVAMAGEASKLFKTLDKSKLAHTQPYRDHTSSVNGLTKTYTDPLEKIVAILKKKNGEWVQHQIIEQRKRDAAEAEANRRLQEKLNEEAKEAGVATVVVPPPANPEFKGVTRSETGSSLHVRLVWKGTITDPTKVPREYCEPNQRKIDDAVKAGVREIEGVTIEEVPESKLRAR